MLNLTFIRLKNFYLKYFSFKCFEFANIFAHTINWAHNNSESKFLSQSHFNHNSTQPQPNITKVGFYMKMTLQTTPLPPPPQKSKGGLQKPQMNIY